jgi:hypothetical protein
MGLVIPIYFVFVFVVRRKATTVTIATILVAIPFVGFSSSDIIVAVQINGEPVIRHVYFLHSQGTSLFHY